jgi:hypothetical protein
MPIVRETLASCYQPLKYESVVGIFLRMFHTHAFSLQVPLFCHLHRLFALSIGACFLPYWPVWPFWRWIACSARHPRKLPLQCG